MANRVAHVAKQLVKRSSPKEFDILAKDFSSPKDASSFGFVEPKNIDIANSFFAELNHKERTLLEERESLRKQLGTAIPWSYYEKNLVDKKVVDDAKEIYENIFLTRNVGPTLPTYEPPKVNEFASRIESLRGVVDQRDAELSSYLREDIVPFLNPFADFWVYEKDGPEFAEIFQARPQWNEMINKNAAEFAFTFTDQDAIENADLKESFNREISEKLSTYKPEATELNLIDQISSGAVNTELNNYYNTNYLAPTEEAQYQQITGEDNANLAVRSGWISTESDPLGKHFGGH